METAALIMLMAGIGLVLLMAWTLYRIMAHRKKMRQLDESALEIGRMSRSGGEVRRPREPYAPTLPRKNLLIVFYRNRKRPWRGAVSKRLREGDKVIIVTPKPPAEIRRMYPGGPLHIWLDRSTAHEIDDRTVLVNPTNLSSILEEIRSHLPRRKGGGVVVFEGFEEVLSGNEIERVVRFLKMLRQSSDDNDISTIVPLPYRAVPQWARNRLMEGFESVVID